jgi:hypothetical protein
MKWNSEPPCEEDKVDKRERFSFRNQTPRQRRRQRFPISFPGRYGENEWWLFVLYICIFPWPLIFVFCFPAPILCCVRWLALGLSIGDTEQTQRKENWSLRKHRYLLKSVQGLEISSSFSLVRFVRFEPWLLESMVIKECYWEFLRERERSFWKKRSDFRDLRFVFPISTMLYVLLIFLAEEHGNRKTEWMFVWSKLIRVSEIFSVLRICRLSVRAPFGCVEKNSISTLLYGVSVLCVSAAPCYQFCT